MTITEHPICDKNDADNPKKTQYDAAKYHKSSYCINHKVKQNSSKFWRKNEYKNLIVWKRANLVAST